MVTWVMDQNRFDEEAVPKMKKEILASGNRVVSCGYYGFGQSEEVDLEHEPVIAFGSINAIKCWTRKYPSWYPHNWCEWRHFYSSTVMTYLSEYSIHQKYGWYPYGVLLKNYKQLYDIYADNDNNVFIKSDSSSKLFDGTVINYHRFQTAIKILGNEIDKHDLILISTPRKILGEWRLIVDQFNDIISGSQYRDATDIKYDNHIPVGVEVFVGEVLDTVWERPAPIFCLDIALTNDGEYSIIELGSVNCAGLYKCDVKPIVDACNTLAEREWKELYCDEDQ